MPRAYRCMYTDFDIDSSSRFPFTAQTDTYKVRDTTDHQVNLSTPRLLPAWVLMLNYNK